jgi:hypothetical protein
MRRQCAQTAVWLDAAHAQTATDSFSLETIDKMAFPVIIRGEAGYGRVYELVDIVRWYYLNGTNPQTRAPLALEELEAVRYPGFKGYAETVQQLKRVTGGSWQERTDEESVKAIVAGEGEAWPWPDIDTSPAAVERHRLEAEKRRTTNLNDLGAFEVQWQMRVEEARVLRDAQLRRGLPLESRTAQMLDDIDAFSAEEYEVAHRALELLYGSLATARRAEPVNLYQTHGLRTMIRQQRTTMRNMYGERVLVPFEALQAEADADLPRRARTGPPPRPPPSQAQAASSIPHPNSYYLLNRLLFWELVKGGMMGVSVGVSVALAGHVLSRLIQGQWARWRANGAGRGVLFFQAPK